MFMKFISFNGYFDDCKWYVMILCDDFDFQVQNFVKGYDIIFIIIRMFIRVDKFYKYVFDLC